MAPCPNCAQEGFDPELNECSICGYGAVAPGQSRAIFRGRIGRDAFWRQAMWLLASAIAVMLCAIPISGRLSQVLAGNSPVVWGLSVVLSLGAVAYGAGFFWRALSAAVRRCHDLNQSGWILLLGFSIVALPVLIIYLAAAQGAGEPNQYGAAALPEAGNSETAICSLDGRIGRARYWPRTLAPLLFLLVLSMVTYLVPGNTSAAPAGHGVLVAISLACVGAFPATLGVLSAALLVAVLTWGAMAAAVKRCHDLGYSGWLALLELIPGLGLLMILWLGSVRGKGEKPVVPEVAPPAPL